MTEWRKVKLGEILQVKKGEYITKKEAREGVYPVILGGKEPAYYIDKYNHTGKAIVISRSGASAGYVSYWNEPIFVTDGFLIEPNDNVTFDFLYYALKSKQRLLHSSQKGAAIPHVTPALINSIEALLPKLDIQRRIAEVLSCYDNLIENNMHRIRLLEQMSENIYKEWFAYNKIKYNSKEVRLTDIISITRGLSYSSEEINCAEGNNLINLKNIQAYGGFRPDGTKKYNGRYKLEQVVREGDLIMGVTDMTQDRRTVGSVALIPNIENLSVISADLIKLNSDIDNIYLYSMFKFGNVSRYIAQFANGANVLHLRPQALHNIKILLPSDEMIQQYVKQVKPMIGLTNKLNTNNDLLARQRDLLLPRLMSGKLEVKG